MNNIPLFTGENGVATLIFKEIPYSGEGYVIFRTVQPGKAAEFAAECAKFCRMAGAEAVYAAGEGLDDFPRHCEVWSMACAKEAIAPGNGLLWPVLPENVAKYRGIYNERMRGVHNAASMAWTDEKRLVKEGGAYFVHRDGQLLGIGQVKENRLETVIATVPGEGATVLEALVQQINADTVRLQVASTNTRAICLYHRLGFLTTGVVNTWYRIQ